jgi:hypothetical protein
VSRPVSASANLRRDPVRSSSRVDACALFNGLDDPRVRFVHLAHDERSSLFCTGAPFRATREALANREEVSL